MATAYTPKSLYMGQLPSTTGSLYTVPASTKAVVHSIVVHNENTTTETFILTINNGSADFKIFKMNITADDTIIIDIPNEGLLLEAAYIIKGVTTTASKVSVFISGSERTTS